MAVGTAAIYWQFSGLQQAQPQNGGVTPNAVDRGDLKTIDCDCVKVKTEPLLIEHKPE